MNELPTSLGEKIRANGVRGELARQSFLRFGDLTVTHAQYYAECRRWAHLFLESRDPARPFHVGLFLDNVPEAFHAIGGAALAGAVIVPIDAGHSGAKLAYDLRQTRCQVLVTEPRHLGAVEAVRGEIRAYRGQSRILISRRHERGMELAFGRDLDEAIEDVRQQLRSRMYEDPGVEIDPDRIFFLRPDDAGSTTQGELVETGTAIAEALGLGPGDVGYHAASPGSPEWARCGFVPSLVAGSQVGLAGPFSETRWLEDVRRYGLTWFHHSGDQLSRILTAPAPAQAGEAFGPLRICGGPEIPPELSVMFAKRFGCEVVDTSAEVGCAPAPVLTAVAPGESMLLH